MSQTTQQSTSQYYGGDVSGGAVGGYIALEKYHEGVLAGQKALLIRNIAHDFAKALKIPVSADASIDKLIASMKRVLPDNMQVVQEGTKQAAVCRALAEAINRRMPRAVIDVDAPAGEICKAISPVLYSLFSGLKTEFLSVEQDVKRVLGNMTILRNSIEAGGQKLAEIVRSSGDPMAAMQATNTEQLNAKLLQEFDRQMAILANVINTTTDPTSRTIADLTAKDTEFRGFVESLSGDLGSDEMSRKLSFLLRGMSNVAQTADAVNQALTVIGATVKDYKAGNTLDSLVTRLYDVFSKHNKSPSADDVAKFIAAIDIVRKNDYAHQDILKYLESRTPQKTPGKEKKKSKTGKTGKKGKKVKGGAAKIGLEARMERQRLTRNVLIRDFRAQLETQYRKIMDSVRTLALRIGKSIPVDDAMDAFVRAFDDLGSDDGWQRENFHEALTGYLDDAVSKNERSRFLSKLDHVSRTLAPLTKGPAGESFKDLKTSIDALRALVDQFQDRYLKPISKIAVSTMPELIGPLTKIEGGAPKDVTPVKDAKDANPVKDVKDAKAARPPRVKKPRAAKETKKAQETKDTKDTKETKTVKADDVHSGADSDTDSPRGGNRMDNLIVDGDDSYQPPSDSDSESDDQEPQEVELQEEEVEGGDVNRGEFITLSQANRHLRFFYKAAQIGRGLKSSNKELGSYSKNYESILGDAVGEMVLRAKREFDELKAKLEKESEGEGALLKLWIDETDIAGVAVPLGAVTRSLINDAPAADMRRLKAWRRSQYDSAMKFRKAQLQAKIDFLKAIEAIDLYLMHFTNAITAKPDEVKELSQLLQSVDIAGKWYTEGSGSDIASLFESFPSYAVDQRDVNLSKESYSRASGDHYYRWVADRIRDVAVSYRSQFPANPFLGMMPGLQGGEDEEQTVLETVLQRTQKAVHGVRVLDNIISTFAKLGSQFGNVKPAEKTFMPPGEILKTLRNYVCHSALVMGWRHANSRKDYVPATNEIALAKVNANAVLTQQAMRDSAAGDSHSAAAAIRMGVDMRAVATPTTEAVRALNPAATIASVQAHEQALNGWVRSRFCIAMSSICESDGAGLPTDVPKNGFQDTWVQTDKLFVMAIKAMTAKIFTVIGTYGVFHKPLDKYSSISPVRMILGGGDAIPEIIPEAVELYVRVPLLAEFYRDALAFKSGDAPETKLISLVPDFDGVWGGLLRIVFDDAKHVEEGSYSESQARNLIHEINLLYKKYKTAGDKTTVIDVIHGLVAEINRRYGVLKQREISQYLKERRRDTSGKDYPSEERLDFGIVDEKVEGRRIAPSDRYDTMLPSERKAVEGRWDFELSRMVYAFREKIDNQIKVLEPSAKTTSFDETIRQYRLQMQSMKSNDDRYKVVLKAMQGADHLNLVNHHKVVMYHEAVVAPLSSLYVLWSLLNKFQQTVHSLDLTSIEAEVEKQCRSGQAVDYNTLTARLAALGKGQEQYVHTGFAPDIAQLQVVAGDATSYHTYNRVATNPANVLVYGGTYGMGYVPGGNLAGGAAMPASMNLTWGGLSALAGQVAHLPDEKVKQNIIDGVKRFAIDRERMFKSLMNLVFTIGSDFGDLTQVKVLDKNLAVEFGSLIEVATGLMTQVKRNLEKFRGVISDDTLKRIEGGPPAPGMGYGDVRRNVGSISWLEENLIERILKGTREDSRSGLGLINEIIQKTFKRLASPWSFVARLDGANGRIMFSAPYVADEKAGPLDKARAIQEKALLADSFDRPVCELAFWDPFPRSSAGAAPGNGPVISSIGTRRSLPHDSKNWLFSVVPNINSLNYDDAEVKQLSSISAQINDTARQIWRTAVDMTVGLPAGLARGQLNAIINAPFVTALGAGAAPSEEFWNATFKSSGPWVDQIWARGPLGAGGADAVPRSLMQQNAVSVFVNAAGVAVNWSQFNTDSHDARVPDTLVAELKQNQPNVYAAKLKTLIEQYSALFKQRDNLRQSTLSAPIPHRTEWFMDPDHPMYGGYMMHQVADQANYAVPFDAGLLVRLNEILARYLYMGWDQTSRRSYAGLIAKFANGTHAQALKGKALNDVFNLSGGCQQGSACGYLGLPAQHVVVFATLARFMRNLMLATKRGSRDFEYRIDSMMEVPLHMKENFRASLPAFSKLFRLMIRKSEMLRQVVQQVSVVRQVAALDKFGTMRQLGAIFRHARVLTIPGAAANGGAAPAASIVKSWPNDAGQFNVNRPVYSPALMAVDQWIHQPSGISVKLQVPDWAEQERLNGAGWINGKTVFTNQGHAQVDAITTLHHVQAAGAGQYAVEINDDKGRTALYLDARALSRNENYAYESFAPVEELTADQTKQWHVALLDDITGMASSLDKCAMEVYKDLGDDPKFLETHDQMISDYQSLHKRMPIMLLSQLQLALRNRSKSSLLERESVQPEWDLAQRAGFASPNFMLPFRKSGDQAFKLLYGSRLVYNRPEIKATLEYMPGMISLLDRYNGVSAGDHRMDKSEFEALAVDHVRLLRMLGDIRHYKPVADGAENLCDTPLTLPEITRNNAEMLPEQRRVDWPLMFRPYAMRRSLDLILGLTESGSQDSNLSDMVGAIERDKKPLDSRKSACVLNLIDLGVVPINVHALMRDLPLVNLINYSYTADRMIQDMLLPDGSEGEGTKLIKPNYRPRTAKGLLTKMLLHPHAELSSREFFDLLSRIITGDTDMGLGRPKYLSDQLWNKGLLQEMHSMPQVSGLSKRPDESGPRADSAQSRIFKAMTDTPALLLNHARGLEPMMAGIVGALIPDDGSWHDGYLSSAGAEAAIRAVLAAVVGAVGQRGQVNSEIARSSQLQAQIRTWSTFLYRMVWRLMWHSANVLQTVQIAYNRVAAVAAAVAAGNEQNAINGVLAFQMPNAAQNPRFNWAGLAAALGVLGAINNVANGYDPNVVANGRSLRQDILAAQAAIVAADAVLGPAPILPQNGAAQWVVLAPGPAQVDVMAGGGGWPIPGARLAGVNVAPGWRSVRGQAAGQDVPVISAARQAGLSGTFIPATFAGTLGRTLLTVEAQQMIQQSLQGLPVSDVLQSALSGFMGAPNDITRSSLMSVVLQPILHSIVTAYAKAANGGESTVIDIVNNGTLQYLDHDGEGKVKLEQLSLESKANDRENPQKTRHDLAIIGRMRFDTTLMRNLFFLVQMQRVMRLLMRNEIELLDSPVLTSSAVVNRQVTDFIGNEMYSSGVFHS